MNKRMKALAIVSGVGGGGKQDDAADAGAKKKVTTRWGRNNKVEPGCSQPGCTRNNTVWCHNTVRNSVLLLQLSKPQPATQYYGTRSLSCEWLIMRVKKIIF